MNLASGWPEKRHAFSFHLLCGGSRPLWVIGGPNLVRVGFATTGSAANKNEDSDPETATTRAVLGCLGR